MCVCVCMYACVRGRGGNQEDEEGVKIQLLSSSSVAVSTSQDVDDNATITAFWEEKTFRNSLILQTKKNQRILSICYSCSSLRFFLSSHTQISDCSQTQGDSEGEESI